MSNGKVFVKWSKGTKGFFKLCNALDFANYIKSKFNEVPFIYDEF